MAFKLIARAPVVFALSLLAACSDGMSDSEVEIDEGAITEGRSQDYESKGAIFGVVDYANRNRIDLDTVVLFGGINFRILNGEADLSAAQQLLDKLNPDLKVKAKADPNGKATVVMQAFMADDVIGCGCPTGFTDVIVNIVVTSDDHPSGEENGATQIVPTFSITNHRMRQKSLNVKFGSPMFLGSPGFIGNSGFYVTDFDGNQVLTIKSSTDLPAPVADPADTLIDVGTHTVGGAFDVNNGQGAYAKSRRTPLFYRTKMKINSARRPFDPATDKITIKAMSQNPATDLGAQLKFIKFTPKTWVVRSTTEIGRAWVPTP